jgi:VanZ family protein
MKAFGLFEHVIAFAIFGALFSFAYLQHVIFVCSAVFTTAAVLEYLQTLTPDRHGTLFDASEKIVGGALGIFSVRAALRLSTVKNVFRADLGEAGCQDGASQDQQQGAQ